MKKIILLFSLVLLFSCSSEDNEDSLQSNSSDNTYWFKITIGDKVYEIEGDLNNYVNTPIYTNNKCQVGINPGNLDWLVLLSIIDPTNQDHVIGNNMTLNLSFQPILGTTRASIDLFEASNPDLNSYFLDNGVVPYFGSGDAWFDSDFYADSYFDSQISSNKNFIDLNILELGVPFNVTNLGVSGGQMLRGSYNGIWYFKDSSYQYNIPFDVSIEFKAFRFN